MVASKDPKVAIQLEGMGKLKKIMGERKIQFPKWLYCKIMWGKNIVLE